MIARRVFDTDVFQSNGISLYTVTQTDCGHVVLDSPDYYACAAINYGRTGGHAVGTCKMGPDEDPDAVVDPRLRVRGVNGLRVIDASIIPVIPRGNVKAAVVMIGEKGSDMIKEDWWGVDAPY